MDGGELPAIQVAGWLGLPRSGRLLSFLSFLVVGRYSFLIIHAVDQVQASPPAMFSSSLTEEHEQLLSVGILPGVDAGLARHAAAAIARQFSAPDAVGKTGDELSVSGIPCLTVHHPIDAHSASVSSILD